MDPLNQLNLEIIKQIRRAVNTALGLPSVHKFGYDFVDAYVLQPCDGETLLVTGYDDMLWWCRQHKYKHLNGYGDMILFKMNPNRHNILIGILEALSAVLRVELLNDSS